MGGAGCLVQIRVWKESVLLITLDLRQIRYFVALYEEQSITRAAERLHVVQPAVSMQIRKVETDYGVTLFDRTSQGVIPNSSADELYRLCIGIMGDLEAAHHFLLGVTGRVFGELAVGVPPSLSIGAMPRILERYGSQFPEVKLRITEGYSSNIVDWLEAGSIDLGILSNESRFSKISTFPIVEEELVVVVSLRNKMNIGAAIDGAEVAKLQLVLPSKPNLLRRVIDTAFEEAGIELDPSLEVDSLTTVLGLLRAGKHVTILPLNCVADITTALDLKVVELRNPSVSRTLIAAHPSQKLLSRPAETFIDILREELVGKASPDSCVTNGVADALSADPHAE